MLLFVIVAKRKLLFATDNQVEYLSCLCTDK